jgi:hypothetical protein
MRKIAGEHSNAPKFVAALESPPITISRIVAIVKPLPPVCIHKYILLGNSPGFFQVIGLPFLRN